MPDHDTTTTIAAAPHAKSSKPHPKPATIIPRAPAALVSLDAAGATRLLIRDLISTASAAMSALPVAQLVSVARLADLASRVTDASAHVVAMDSLASEAEDLAHAMTMFLPWLQHSDEVGAEYETVASLLAKCQHALARHGKDAGANQASRSTAPLQSTERVSLIAYLSGRARDLATQTVQGARDDGAAAVVDKMGELPGLFRTAAAETLQISRTESLALTRTIEDTSDAMELLNQWLSKAPAIPWHSTLARTFDAENMLRQALGVRPRVRSYTGTVDPEAALTAIERGVPADGADHVMSASPHAAIEKIKEGIQAIGTEQQTGATAALAALGDPTIQAEASLLKTVAIGVLEVGATFVSAGLSRLMQVGITEALEARVAVKAAGAARATMKKLAKADIDTITQSAIRGSALVNSMIAEGAKSIAKEFFTKSSKAGIALLAGQHISSAVPLTAFRELHGSRLDADRLARTLAFADLAEPLGYADLPSLNRLTGLILHQLVPAAHELEKQATTVAWENFRAVLAAGPAKARTGLPDHRSAERDEADVRAAGTPGVIDALIYMENDPDQLAPRVKQIGLRGAEAAALAQLTRSGKSMGQSGLNVRCDVELGASRGSLFGFALSPTLAIQWTSLNAGDWAALGVFASGQKWSTDRHRDQLFGQAPPDVTGISRIIRVIEGAVSVVPMSRLVEV